MSEIEHEGIESLELHNFKSFKGNHIIGPFLDLTAIIGPNGSGKSNILDAICFVLAIHTTNMREGNLRQFLYRSDTLSGKNTEAWVRITLSSKVHFKRVLNKGSTTYFTEDKKVTYEVYIKLLEKHRLLCQTRNYFLVLQGEIDSILQNCGKDLGKIIESISGSGEYKVEYDVYKNKLGQVKQSIANVSKSLQELRSEKRRAKEIKNNVEAFEKAREKVTQLQLELYATMCCTYDKKIGELEEKKGELDEKVKAQEVEEENLFEKRRELKVRLKDISETEQECELNLEEVKSKNETYTRQLKKLDIILELWEKECKEKIDKKQYLEQKLAEESVKKEQLQEELRLYEKEYNVLTKQLISKNVREAPKELSEKYYKVKNKIDIQTFDYQKEIQRLTQLTELYSAKRLILSNKEKELHKDKESLQEEIRNINIERIESELDLAKENQSKCMNRLLQINIKEREQELLKLQEELVVAEYNQMRVQQNYEFKQQNDKEYHLIEHIRTKLKGCYGFLRQLVHASQKKYELALKAALGNYLTSLVVDDESTAISCKVFLKDNGIMKDIIILNNIPKKTHASNIESAIRLIDVIEYNGSIKGLKEAIMYLAKDKVICEDIKEKKFNDAVTLNGIIMREGIISCYREDEDLRNRDYESRIEMAKEVTNKIKEQIKQCNISEYQKDILETKNNLEIYNRKVVECEKVLNDIVEEKEKLLNELMDIEKSIKVVKEEVDILNESEELVNAQIKDYRDKVTGIKSKALNKLGIRDISEYESNNWIETNSLYKKKTDFIARIEQINAQLELLRLPIIQEKTKTLRHSIKQLKEKITHKETEKAELKETSTIIKQQYKDLMEKLMKLQQAKNNIVEEQEHINNKLKLAINEYKKYKDEAINIVCQIRTNAHLKLRTVDELKLKGIPISFFSQRNDEVDYKKYDIDINLYSSKELEERQITLQQAITKEEKFMSTFNAFALMKDNEEGIEEMDKEIKVQRDKLEELLKEYDVTEQAFKKIKEPRKEAFKSCFEQLNVHVDKVYEELTRTEEAGLVYGGHAILLAENIAEPYEGEIQYAPTPPGKRVVYELEQLSGGEKALAALSLVFAVQKYRRAPIIVLDEVDAHLDAHNVKKLGEYLRKAVERKEFQCIIISHREILVETSDSLLGIAHSKQMQSSQVFSLDLRDFIE